MKIWRDLLGCIILHVIIFNLFISSNAHGSQQNMHCLQNNEQINRLIHSQMVKDNIILESDKLVVNFPHSKDLMELCHTHKKNSELKLVVRKLNLRTNAHLLDVLIGYEEVPCKNFNLKGRVKIYRQIPVANKFISIGTLLKQTDISNTLLPLSKIHNKTISKHALVINSVAKENIAKGKVFTTRNITIKRNDADIVLKDASVTILFQTENFKLEGEGYSLENGVKGDMIKVNSLISNKIIDARVIDSKLVLASY